MPGIRINTDWARKVAEFMRANARATSAGLTAVVAVELVRSCYEQAPAEADRDAFLVVPNLILDTAWCAEPDRTGGAGADGVHPHPDLLAWYGWHDGTDTPSATDPAGWLLTAPISTSASACTSRRWPRRALNEPSPSRPTQC